ncbi:zinc finger protein 518B [Pyxicephalus adspersus]|uniref:zinc finger protein 518B n=1 Tax=Pyxicephalus adspersus TaxID=30357 RepID=UPI003B59B83C
MNSLPQFQILEKYNCEKCRFSTKDLNRYKIHIALHNEMKYVCSHCNFESYTKTEFQRHLVSHTGKFPYTCEYCGYGAIRNDYIVKHIKRIHGDGKIQCSVSTVENEFKNASINIVQAQMRNHLQEILPNTTTLKAKNFIDLTSEGDNSIVNNSCHLNENGTHVDQLEVEVISPTDQQLHPWTPLTVIAPTSFRAPGNCFAQVVEVKSTNGGCHLVLKCLPVTDSNGTKNVSLKEKSLHEQNSSEPMVTSENSIGSLKGSSLSLGNTESPLPTKADDSSEPMFTSENSIGSSLLLGNTKSPLLTKAGKNLNGLTSQLNDNEIINALNEVPNEFFDENVEVSDGPVISSVFSLSSDSQNVIEGIQWEDPIVTNTNAAKDILDTTPCLNGMESQCETKVLGKEENSLVEIEKNCEPKAIVENKLPETNIVEVKTLGPEIQSPIKPVLPHGKKTESQTSAFMPSNRKGGCKSNHLSKTETNLFSKPQTLFLSCDKRIVMQPLSCVMHTGKSAASRENELVQLKVKRQSAKPKGKILTKRFTAPMLKTLRLYPAKSDQMTQTPHKNQPVVVLNHPELESLEVSSIMKAIGMFKGMVLKVTISKQTLRKLSEY